ncbi:hypothetical protein Mahau_1137 [Mahella australiensis 50-1 BON]|uniref:Prepilin-type N-terminal cleavage/methylation domain-containing protein n=2 Tax=Mahella TaxID=252965 RepID=F3ZVH2_MAHA5|nr:hypothetical protein Mahau_1137 [Mahella australiensis 50-1 BON]
MMRNNKDRGFTLVEVVIAVAIMAIVLDAAYMLLLSGRISFERVSAYTDVEQNVRFAMGDIMRALRAADGSQIVADVLKDRITVGKATFYRYGSSLYEKIDGVSNEMAYYIKSFDVNRTGNTINIVICGDDEKGHSFSMSGSYTIRE